MRRHREQAESNARSVKPKAAAGRRFPKRYVIGIPVALVLFVIAFGIPVLVRTKSVFLGAIKSSGALGNLQLDVDSIQFGWFTPFALNGLKISDDTGKAIGTVEQVQSQLTLWRLIRNRSDLGTIALRKAELFVEVRPGTTSLEEALKPMLESKPDENPSPSSSASQSISLQLLVEASIVHAVDQLTQRGWDVRVERTLLDLSQGSQAFPSLELIGTLTPIQSNPASNAKGEFALKMAPSSVADAASPLIKLEANLNAMPLEWWDLLKRRLPDLPIEQMTGTVSLQAIGDLRSATRWEVEVQKGTVERLAVAAPTLLGAKPALLNQAGIVGKWTLADNRLVAYGNQLVCDFGDVRVTGNVPWPVTAPAVTSPWIPGGAFDVQGKLDIPKLLAVAPTLVTIRENTEIVSGQADVRLSQTLDPRGLPQSSYQLTLGDLEARVQGQEFRWEDPLKADMQVQPDAAGNVRFQGDLKAEFCDLQGNGNLKGGRVTGSVDLDRLQRRLEDFLKLPIDRITGSAEATFAWEQNESGQLHAEGQVQTTSLALIAPGGELTEPAWRGEVDLDGRFEGSQFTRIDRGRLTLRSTSDNAQLELFEPISLVANSPALPPATAKLKLQGDMAGWQRRASLLQAWVPGLDVGGDIDLEATAVVDAKHAEIKRASWTAKPLSVKTSSMAIVEPQMKGEFTGLVDTQDLTRLEVSNLEVQATSFALRASDRAKAGDVAGAREGQGVFRINLASLMSSVTPSSPPGSRAATNNTASNVKLSGEFTGQASWAVSQDGLAWQIDTDGSNLRIENPTPTSPMPRGSLVSTSANASQLLLEEPQLKAICSGSWSSKDGKISIPTTQLQTEWIAYGGKVDIENVPAGQQIRVQGQYTYDAQQAALRLAPWVGTYVQMTGQRTEPIDLVMLSPNDPTKSLLKTLQGNAKIGWDSAKVVGIDVGPSDIPVAIREGVFQTASEIAVSKGKLRFDLTGDLLADNLVIRQKPDIVIEKVAITPEMYQGWLKYITPIIAEATSAEGEMSLKLDRADLVPTNPRQQNIAGQLMIHRAVIGPGPLSNQVLLLVKQIDAMRKGQPLESATASANEWLQMPEQTIDFAVEDGRVIHKNLRLELGEVIVTTSGGAYIDGGLDMVASIPIKDDWVKQQQYLAPLVGKSLDFPIRGTLAKPQLDTRGLAAMLANLGASAAMQAGQNTLQRELNKQLQKLPFDKLEKPIETLDKFFAPLRPQLPQAQPQPQPQPQVPQ